MAGETITEAILASIGDWISDIISRVSEWLWNNFQPVFDKIASWLDNVFGRLETFINKLVTFIEGVWDTITKKIGDLVSSALEFVREVFDRVASAITELFDTVTEYLSGAFETVVETIIGIGDRIKNFAVDVYDAVVGQLESITDTIVTWVRTLFEDVKLSITTLVDRAADIVTAIYDGIKEFISEVIDTIGVGLKTLLETVSSIPDSLESLGAGFAEAVREYIGEPLEGIPPSIWNALTESASELFSKSGVPGIGNNPTLVGTIGGKPKSRAEWDDFFKGVLPGDTFASGLFNGITTLFFTMQLFSGVAQAQAQIVLQEYGDENPYNIPAIAETIKLRHFNIVDNAAAVAIIKKQGFSTEDADRLIKIGETVPPEGEALSWWLREIYDDVAIDDALARNGWNEADSNALKQAAFFIPPVQDLITMAVREVFTPAVAERFGQFEDFPQDFADHAKKTGVSEEWARNYWAAHWALPSPQMGFEMLHRRVIERSDLDMLLKASDVMPFWRPKIIDISYAPFTRVDIRRMHKVGVLTETEVFEAYQDIGYNVDKAQRLTDFTVELNKPKAVDDDIELVVLTRSNVLGFYMDGLLDYNEALSMLLDMGLSNEAANLYLVSIDLDEQRVERKADSGLILDQFKAGLTTFDDAQNLLSRLGLESREFNKAVTKLIRLNAQKAKLPSKGDLDKMVIKGIVEKEEYIDTLNLLGYSDLWAERLFQLLEIE